MFNAKLRESSQKEISILGMSTEVFKVVMTYCYTWEMGEIPPDFVGEVLEATDQFMIEGLRHCAGSSLSTCFCNIF